MGGSPELRTILLKLETKQFYHHFPVNFVLINAKHCQLWLLFPKSQRKVYIFVKENKIQLFVMGVWEMVGDSAPVRETDGITATCGAEAGLGMQPMSIAVFHYITKTWVQTETFPEVE